MYVLVFFFFFFNDTATTEIYTLSLHDALPIFRVLSLVEQLGRVRARTGRRRADGRSDRSVAMDVGVWPARRRQRVDVSDRKSTRLNSSHSQISYAVFCLKKKKMYTERHVCTAL